MFIKNYIKDSIATKQKIFNDEKMIFAIEKIAEVIIKAYKENKKVLIAGNGGSAADAQHIAGELVSKFYFDRPGLSAIALNANTSIITAIANDYGYEQIFSRQIQANGQIGDIFIGISTSGNSKNIVLALEEAKKKGLVTICLTGEKPCKSDELCDYVIKVPSSETPKIQESHIMIGHIVCAIVEEKIFRE
jgi:D-sedoheptulose 7-phosphate isomerase